MLRSAVKDVAGLAGNARAAALGAALVLLAACGGQAPDKTAAAKPGAADPGGATISATGANSPLAQQTATTAASLDTSTWVLAPPFYAGGDEPAWKLDVGDGWFSFKRSGLPKIETPIVQPKKVGAADVFESDTLKITIKREACMTDEVGNADVSATVTFDGTDFDGCAMKGQSAGASPEAGQVVDALAQIDMCLAKAGVPAIVTAVYPREGDRTAVGLKGKDGSFYECAVEPGGKEIAYLDTIDPNTIASWQSRMRFLRTGVADATKCDDTETVKAGDKVVGRLLGKKCKF
ncbi:MAG TPA: hypothetical protein VG942_18940 [Hyphomonadaceae bacterium]|nr:hypothetical protein [Hyphomonadaceae bacterium]